MFRLVITALTAATVLWHAAVGCCAHHEHQIELAHAVPLVAGPKHAASETSSKGRCCKCKKQTSPCHEPRVEERSGKLAESQNHDRDSHPAQAPCDEEQCVLAAGKIFSAAESVHGEVFVAWLFADGYSTLDGRTVKGERFTLVDDRPPPLRLHLALRILLI